MLKGTTLLALGLFALGLSPAAKATITFNFLTDGGPVGQKGTTDTFTGTGGITILATGCVIGTSCATVTGQQDLFIKSGGAGEQGLGVFADGGSAPSAEHEIRKDFDVVQLDLSNVLAQFGGTVNLVVAIGSAQTGLVVGEPAALYLSDSVYGGSFASLTKFNSGTSNSGDVSVSFTTSQQYLFITTDSTSDHADYNVLLSTLTATPEPGFYGALALGLSGLYFAGIRRRKQA